MNKKVNIIFGICLSFISLIASLVIHVFYTPFLLKSVGDAEYGIFSYALSITSWITILSSALTAAYIKYINIAEKKDKEKGPSKFNGLLITLFLIIDLIVCVVFFIFFVLFKTNTIVIGSFSGQERELFNLLFLISGTQLIISIPMNVFSLYITFKSRFIYLKFISLLTTVSPYLISIPFLLSGAGVISFLLINSVVLVVSFLLNAGFSIFVLKQKFSFKFKSLISDGMLRSILFFTFAMLFIEIVDKLNATSDKIILGSFVSAESVTYYQLGLSFTEFLTTLSLAISTVFIPTINSLHASGQKEKINTLFLDTSFVQMLLLFFVVGGFASCGREFITLWVGQDKSICYWIALSLLLISIAPLSQNVANEVQKAYNLYLFRIKVNFISVLINVSISIVLIFILGKDYAILACLLGTLSTSLVSKWIILSFYNSKKIGLPMNKYWINILKFLAIAVSGFGFAFFVNFVFSKYVSQSKLILFLVTGFAYCLIYVPFCLVAFKKENAKILNVLKGIFKKQSEGFTNE